MHHRAIRLRRPAILAAAFLGALYSSAFVVGCAPSTSARFAPGDAYPARFDTPRIEAKRVKLAERGPKRTDAPQEAMDYFMQQRLPQGMTTYPIDRVQAAAADFRARRVLRGATGLVSSWEEVGPGNIDRKSVVEGKREDLGGSRIKKKK